MAKLIVALDYDDAHEAMQMANLLQGKVEWVKVGLELFITEGPRLIQSLKAMKYKVFLDLKLYDIPNTVRGAVLAAARHKADMLTLHLSGGENMVTEALNCVKGEDHQPLLFGVTILTSFSDGELPCFTGSLTEIAQRLADEAYNWEMNGIVCSGHEVEQIKKRHPKLLTLCPGIRMADGEANDQKRVMTPYQAIKNGADFIVVGRPITKAEDPLAAAEAILANMQEAEAEMSA